MLYISIYSISVFLQSWFGKSCCIHYLLWSHQKVELDWPVMNAASSVTRLGDSWKFLVTNLLTKVAQKDYWLLGYFEKDQLMKKLLLIFLGNLWKHLGNFIPPTAGHTGCEWQK